MLDEFRSIQRFRVQLADIDMFGHVNNVAYLRWCETARTEYYYEVMREKIDGPRGIIQAKIEFSYERQVEWREEIAVGARVRRIGTKSFDVAYEVWSETHGHRCAHGVSPLVAYDYIARKSVPVPEEWRSRILAFEIVPPTFTASAHR